MRGEKHLTHQNFSAGFLMIWGIFTANPFDDTFARQPKLYAAMTELSDNQIFWGLLFFIIGAVSVYLNYHRRQTAAFLLGATFFFLASLFFFGDYSSRAWAGYGLFAVWNLTQWKFFNFGSKRA